MRTLLTRVASTVFCAIVLSSALPAQNPIDFGRDIQPILSENCYFCHGPDANQRQSDLRLDLEDEANRTYLAGDAAGSDLFDRISTDDDDVLMPPPESKRELTKKEKQLIERWINEGAQWNQHWAFEPIVRPDVPGGQNPIDFFVQRKLGEVGLKPSPLASRRELARRVSLDLTGLPPVPDQVQLFVGNQSNDAYSKMVDQNLASPAYGERMAWDWLDAARYADTNGYQGDNERTMWPWRDWVVKALNENMPFDQFSRWQLAGDLIPNATDEQILATGFLRNHPINGEGGRIAAENRIEYVMDMAETTGTVWMGLTFNCCRCHDHKYDQISQKDYYSLFAFFNQTPIDGSGGNAQTAPVLAVPSNAQKGQIEKLKSEIADLAMRREKLQEQIVKTQPEWETKKLASLSLQNSWRRIEATSFEADHSKIKLLDDESLLSFGPNPDNDNYRISGHTNLERITGIRLEALPHELMTAAGLARSNSSNFVLTDFAIEVRSPKQEYRRLKLSTAKATYSQSNHDVVAAIDGDLKSGWAVYDGRPVTQKQAAVFVLAEPFDVPEGAEFRFVLKHESNHKFHNLGRFRLSLTDQMTPQLPGVDADLAAALATAIELRNKKQEQIILAALLRSDDAFQKILLQIDGLEKQQQKLLVSLPKVMVMADQSDHRKTYLLERGSYEKPLGEVTAAVPALFGQLAGSQIANRLALADWLFAETNPLTARVAVNRIWSKFFASGLVKTTEDFGVQGERPTHPQLLDWLAAEYQASGWDTKHLIRVILNSETYQQSSKVDPELWQLDPDNRLLARAARFRMPSWMIRDHALATSGRLVHKTGGKPVNTYQPAGVWEESSFGKKQFKLDSGDALYRRSLYTFWRRIAAPTMFFDNADRMICSVKKYKTNTPLHALQTLNDVTYVEAARLLATDVLQTSQTDAEVLNTIFMRVLTRSSNPSEQEIILAALNRTRQQFSRDQANATRLLNVGESAADPRIDKIELASWTSVCLAILNLDEALTRQ